MKKSKEFSILFSLFLVLIMLVSMMAVSTFSASAFEDVEWDDEYILGQDLETYNGQIPDALYTDFDVYKWDRYCKTVDGAMAVEGPYRPDDIDPNAGGQNWPYVHAKGHGVYHNGFLDFFHVYNGEKGFSGLTYNKQEVVNFKLELDYFVAWARRSIMIGPKGEFAVSDDGDPTNDLGIVIFMEVEGRINVAGAIDPKSARCTNPEIGMGIGESEEKDFPNSPHIRTDPVVYVDYPIEEAKKVTKQTDHPILCVEVNNGVLTIYEKSHDENTVTVNLTSNYQGGYITIMTNNIQQGSWRGISIKKEPYTGPSTTKRTTTKRTTTTTTTAAPTTTTTPAPTTDWGPTIETGHDHEVRVVKCGGEEFLKTLDPKWEVYAYNWNPKTADETKAIKGPLKPSGSITDFAGAEVTAMLCREENYGSYNNGYLKFALAAEQGKWHVMTNTKDKVGKDFVVEVVMHQAYGQMGVILGGELGKLPWICDEDFTNDTGVVVFMETEGPVNIAGAIKPDSLKVYGGLSEKANGSAKDNVGADYDTLTSYRINGVGKTYFPEKGVVSDKNAYTEQRMVIRVKDGVLKVYGKSTPEKYVTVELADSFKGGYISLTNKNPKNGSFSYVGYSDLVHTEHTYGDWTVTKEATTEEAGEERRDCTECDHFETREIPKLEPAFKAGWNKIDGKWYYLDANGEKVTNKWMKDSKGWVKLGADGAMLTNKWTTDSKGWCYVGADGYAVTNCWKKDNTGWIYLNAEGSMTKAKWVLDGGKWYYLDANGYMVTNKRMKDSKGWVKLGADGAMLTNKWTTDSKGWCYVGANGYAVTNTWKKDNTGWIYLDKEGSMTKAKWVKDGGKWYYCDGNGYMVAGKSMKIGNKTYKFNASGVCTNP